MSTLYNTVPFKLEDRESIDIYLNQLLQFDYELCEKALNELIKTNKYCPTIAEISEKTKQLTIAEMKAREIDEAIKNNKECPICEGKGFVVVTQELKSNSWQGKKLKTQHVAYCDKCAQGEKYKFDGRTIASKDHRTEYYSLPYSAYGIAEESTQIEKLNTAKIDLSGLIKKFAM